MLQAETPAKGESELQPEPSELGPQGCVGQLGREIWLSPL